LLIAVLAGLGGMLGWGISEFATKKAVDKIGSISSLVWAHVFGTVLLFALLTIKILAHPVPDILHFSVGELIGVIFFGTLQTIVYYFAYTAFEKGKVSILSPIFASFAGLVAVGSVLLFGEVVHAGLAVALLVIFGGVLLINTDPETLRLRKFRMQGVPGLREILIATVLATIWTLGWDKFTADKDWLVYTTLMFVFMSVSAFLFAYLSNTKLLHMKRGAWGFLWLIAIGEVVAYLAITLGYSTTTHASVVAIFSGASSLPTILLARIFIKEKISTLQMIATFIIIVGIILIAIA
jgi:drug/metabolite transporter (DMT)-like permease